MQLGMTVPLQKFLKLPKPPYGEPIDPFFCWEIHKVPDLNRSTFIAVNASNRFALVFVPMKAASWKHLKEIVPEGIAQAMAYEGYSSLQIATYLAAAGEPEFTKTHGSRPVAGLNRVADFLYWIEKKSIDGRQLFQPLISEEINRELCHVAGYSDEGFGYPREFFKKDMIRLGIPGEMPSSRPTH